MHSAEGAICVQAWSEQQVGRVDEGARLPVCERFRASLERAAGRAGVARPSLRLCETVLQRLGRQERRRWETSSVPRQCERGRFETRKPVSSAKPGASYRAGMVNDRSVSVGMDSSFAQRVWAGRQRAPVSNCRRFRVRSGGSCGRSRAQDSWVRRAGRSAST